MAAAAEGCTLSGLTQCPLRGSGLLAAAPGDTTHSPEPCSGTAGSPSHDCKHQEYLYIVLDITNIWLDRVCVLFDIRILKCFASLTHHRIKNNSWFSAKAYYAPMCQRHRDLFQNESKDLKPKAFFCIRGSCSFKVTVSTQFGQGEGPHFSINICFTEFGLFPLSVTCYRGDINTSDLMASRKGWA